MEQKYITVCVLVVLFVTPVQGDTEWTSDDVWCLAKKVGGSVVVGTGAVALAPVALGAVGFGSAGIIAGSTAAKIMTGLAASNGVGVAAGSLFAAFQSAGAAGLAIGTKLAIGTSVGGTFGYFSGGCSNIDSYTDIIYFSCVDKSTNNNGWTSDDVWCLTKTYGGAAILGASSAILAPSAFGVVVIGFGAKAAIGATVGGLYAAGFTTTGIAAKSLAAKAMAISAVSNGGGVTAAGAVAALQYAGAAGFGLGTKVAIVTTSGGMYNYIFGSRTERDVERTKKQNEN
ncbi:unnamed protein product [Mytilus edulis]|uniref:Uncharacterized protein n=1 Tax=Mytilus edulis TaxID=6550 RepID=A0A8S3RSC3_MYTED|nr:unnamed protein product [Mytilus edulis]